MDKSFTAGSAAGHVPVQPVPTANVPSLGDGPPCCAFLLAHRAVPLTGPLTSQPSPTHLPTLNLFCHRRQTTLSSQANSAKTANHAQPVKGRAPTQYPASWIFVADFGLTATENML
jgi:hypothetical protein